MQKRPRHSRVEDGGDGDADDDDDDGNNDGVPPPPRLGGGGGDAGLGLSGGGRATAEADTAAFTDVPVDPRAIAGYMPLRRDFAVAWDNADDDLVGTIDVSAADRDVDKKLKEEILRSFHGVARQRDAMSAFVIDHGLVDPVSLAYRARACVRA